MFRYVHSSIIAKDADKLIGFYKEILHCKSFSEKRDLSGEWLDKLTGLNKVHITGEHLLLPGYGKDYPTLEILEYETMKDTIISEINHPGFAHIAFEVDDVEATLAEIISAGGSSVGEMVTAEYPNSMEAVIVYAKDPEGNIIELQSWKSKKDE